jgi:hypothetical protein
MGLAGGISFIFNFSISFYSFKTSSRLNGRDGIVGMKKKSSF